MLARPALLTLATLLLLTAPAQAVDAPPLDALVGRISMSLGGPSGGSKVLDDAPGVEMVFRRTVRESHSSKELTADHRYVESKGRIRVDVRMVEGDGKDSAMVLDTEEGWLLADGGLHPIDRGALIAQLGEFDPRRLWSVPFALASEGRQILQAASLEVEGRVKDDEGDRIVMVGRDEEGEETSRVEVDAANYRPTRVQFLSSSGRVEYRYADWREAAPGLIVPFLREFYRNGTRLSRTRVVALELRAPQSAARLFDRDETGLVPIVIDPKALEVR